MTGTSVSVGPARVSRVCTGHAHLRRHVLKGEEKGLLTPLFSGLFPHRANFFFLFLFFLFWTHQLWQEQTVDLWTKLLPQPVKISVVGVARNEAFQSFIEKKKNNSKTKNKPNLVLFQQHDSSCLQILCCSLGVLLGAWEPFFFVPIDVKEAKLKKRKVHLSELNLILMLNLCGPVFKMLRQCRLLLLLQSRWLMCQSWSPFVFVLRLLKAPLWWNKPGAETTTRLRKIFFGDTSYGMPVFELIVAPWQR